MEKIKCIKIEVGKEPSLEEIDNTLRAMQEWVGGYIETVTCSNGLVVIVNEEGRCISLPENCKLPTLHDALRIPICGNALVVRHAAGMFIPVTKADFRTIQQAWEVGRKYG